MHGAATLAPGSEHRPSCSLCVTYAVSTWMLSTTPTVRGGDFCTLLAKVDAKATTAGNRCRAGASGGHAYYHDPVPTPIALRLPGWIFAFVFVFLTAAACGSPTQAMSSASSPASSGSAHVSADERHAVLAFSGTYRVKSVVTATAGSYAESVGAVHLFTWQAIPDCSGQSCVVKITSSSGSHTILTFSNGEFLGTGSGSATCVDPVTGTPTGISDPTTLHDTLLPAKTSSPATSLTGIVHLTVSGNSVCGGGTGTFSYTLTRTGIVSPGTSTA